MRRKLGGLLLGFGLRRYAYRDGLLWNRFGGERHGSQHGVFADLDSGEHGCVVGDAGAGAEFGDFVGDVRPGG